MQYLIVLVVVVVLGLSYMGCKPSSGGDGWPVGAMCYKVAVELERVEYVCPVCGEKSLFSTGGELVGDAEVVSIGEIEACRMIVKEIEGVEVRLDESQFCHECGGGVVKPELGIVVRDEQTGKGHRCWGVDVMDIVLIRDYYAGQALNEDTCSRLKELLGESFISEDFTLGRLSKGATQEQIEARLEKIATLPSSVFIGTYAMCYSMAGPPVRSEYVCVRCGEKTLYALGDGTGHEVLMFVEYKLPRCRDIAKEIEAFSIELDESQYCQKCSGIVEEPKLGIVVSYAGSVEKHRCWGVYIEDLRLILEVEQGKVLHRDSNDWGRPIKEYIDRLEELLGVDIEKKE